MRRVVRAGSPEVLWNSDASPSSAETSFRELDDVFVQTQTRIWLGEVLHIRFDEETAIADLLADGELLFQVSKVVWKMLLKKHVELKHSNIYIYERTSFGKNDGRYMPYPKVDSFLKICQILGLTGIDLFSPSDIVEKRDVRRVCMCIRSLSKKARSKNLDVPDFDIVTYTIAMPTDLVGGIRRNLEQSQCSSSSSNGCSPCTDAREMYRQKSFGGDYARHYDSYYESDEAESTSTEFDFQSPLSNLSNDAANLSHIVGEISLGRSSIFDEKTSKLQTEFQPINLDQNEDGNKSSVASYAKAINNGNDQFKVAVHSNSSCAEFPSDQGVRACFAGMGEMMRPISKLKSSFLINNVDTGCLETRASSFENSPLELDEQHSANAKETFEGNIGSMIWSKGLENSVSNHRDFDSYKNFDYVEEEFMQAIVDPSGQVLEVNRTAGDIDNVRDEFTTLLEETSNKCYAYTTDAHDGKPSCNIIMGSSDIAHDNVALEACIMNGEGKKDNSTSSIIQMHASSLVKNRSLPGNCTDLRPGTSDLALDNADGDNFIQSVQSVCKGYRNGVEKKSLDEVVDAEVDSTPSLHVISDNASDDKADSSDCTANSFFLSEAFEQCNFELETSASELVGSLAEEAMNSNLYDVEANAHKMNIFSFEIDCTGESSASETESPAIYDLSLLDCFTCGTEELNSCMETENPDSVVSFSSIAGKKQRSMGILNDLQLDRDCSDFSHLDSSLVDNNLVLPTYSDSSNDPGMIENKNHSFTCTVISDDCDLYKGKCALPPNDCPHIIGSFKEVRSLIPNSVVQDTNVSIPDLEVDADKSPNDSIMTTEYGDITNPDITANSLSVGESKTYDDTMGCLKHVPSTSFNLDGVEIQLMARECNSETDGETKMKVVKQNDTCYYPCDTNNNMQVEFRESLCEKLHVKNGLGENTSDNLEYGNNICFPLNERDDDGCLISICVQESDDSQMEPTTGCRGCNVTTLSEENGTIADLHAIVSSNILSNSDAGCSSNNRTQQIIVNASDNTTLPMGNAVAEKKVSEFLRFDYLSEIHELPTEGMKSPVDLNGIYTQGSDILDRTKSTVIDNVTLEAPNQHHVSDPFSCCDHLHNNCPLQISSGTHFEESRQTQVILSCSSASMVDTETCTQESIRVEAQVLPLVDVLTTVKPKEEKGTDIEEFKTEPVTMLGSSGKDKEGVTGELHRPSRKVLTSVAGGVTLLGALFFLLHRRGRRGNQKTKKTVVPLQTQKSGQEGSAPKQTETNSTAGLYPADRLKF